MSLVTVALVNGILAVAIVAALTVVCRIPYRADRTARPRRGFRLAALAALSTGLLLVTFAAAGTAVAGNSTAAKKCQKNGWQTLVTSSGTGFATEEACTSSTRSSAWPPVGRPSTRTR